MSENGITIELSKAQVNRVLRNAAEDDGLLGRVRGMGDLEFQVSPAQLDDRRLSRSLLRGLMILASFPGDGTGRSVTDVAHQFDMQMSTTHRYISTLVEVGLLERDPFSREYRLAVRG
jgi:DNA-binding MarR family transcriptional regulator